MALLEGAHLTSEQVENSHLRLNVRDQIEFTTRVSEAIGDEYLGVHLAELPDLREMGLLYYVLASSEVLIDAFHRVARYSSIVNEGISATCVDGTNVGMSLRYVGVSRHLDRHQIEYWMVVFVRTCRLLTGLQLVPNRVRLMHVRKHHGARLPKFFGDDIEFGAAVDEITFPTTVRDLPIIGADHFLNRLLVAYCEEAIAHRTDRPGLFQTRVENAIVPLLPHGEASVGQISRHLGVSKRTFARRLSLEGLTFSSLLDRLRSDLANRYLADENLSISQIAWLLGYNEVSSFSHAFKRWTGRTPRNALVGGLSQADTLPHRGHAKV